MKKTWIWIIVAVVVLGAVGYAYKHQIKLLLMGSGTPATSLYGNPSSNSAAPAAAPTSADIITTMSGAKGNYLVGASGMTLYVFDKDTKGVSNCSGSCAGLWPPYTTSSAPTTLPTNVSLITRADGTMQFAYKGLPLYYYSGDQATGDMTGDGFNGIWHIVKP